MFQAVTDMTETRGAQRLAHVLGVLDREGVRDPRDARKRLKLLGFDNEKTIAAAENVLQCRGDEEEQRQDPRASPPVLQKQNGPPPSP
jgi:hypothetical protein